MLEGSEMVEDLDEALNSNEPKSLNGLRKNDLRIESSRAREGESIPPVVRRGLQARDAVE